MLSEHLLVRLHQATIRSIPATSGILRRRRTPSRTELKVLINLPLQYVIVYNLLLSLLLHLAVRLLRSYCAWCSDLSQLFVYLLLQSILHFLVLQLKVLISLVALGDTSLRIGGQVSLVDDLWLVYQLYVLGLCLLQCLLHQDALALKVSVIIVAVSQTWSWRTVVLLALEVCVWAGIVVAGRLSRYQFWVLAVHGVVAAVHGEIVLFVRWLL